MKIISDLMAGGVSAVQGAIESAKKSAANSAVSAIYDIEFAAHDTSSHWIKKGMASQAHRALSYLMSAEQKPSSSSVLPKRASGSGSGTSLLLLSLAAALPQATAGAMVLQETSLSGSSSDSKDTQGASNTGALLFIFFAACAQVGGLIFLRRDYQQAFQSNVVVTNMDDEGDAIAVRYEFTGEELRNMMKVGWKTWGMGLASAICLGFAMFMNGNDVDANDEFNTKRNLPIEYQATIAAGSLWLYTFVQNMVYFLKARWTLGQMRVESVRGGIGDWHFSDGYEQSFIDSFAGRVSCIFKTMVGVDLLMAVLALCVKGGANTPLPTGPVAAVSASAICLVNFGVTTALTRYANKPADDSENYIQFQS